MEMLFQQYPFALAHWIFFHLPTFCQALYTFLQPVKLHVKHPCHVTPDVDTSTVIERTCINGKEKGTYGFVRSYAGIPAPPAPP